ncbi:MAG: L-seryl-tRNA(Sec) selenium transferase, partial [Nitrospirota bacterium]
EEKAKKDIPTLRMLLQDINEIKARAKKIAAKLHREIKEDIANIEVMADSSQSGGGALPEIEFKTYVIAIKPKKLSVNKLEERLRHGNPPIIARIKEDALIIDARTVRDRETEVLVKGISGVLL